VQRFLGYLTIAYLKFRVWQKRNGNHPNFHGSRDIYGVSKFIYANMMKIKHYDTAVKAKDLIKLAIERNFNGAIYIFGDEHIQTASIQNLEEGFPKKNYLSMIRIKEFGDIYDRREDKLDSFLQNQDDFQTEDNSKIFGGTEIFKKLFANELQSQADIQLFSKDYLDEYSVLDLINQNIQDKASRFLLVKSEGEVIDNIFIEKLREFNNTDKIVDWRGIKGKENSIELLSTLKSYISLGYVVIMKNLDELYGSLYDLFNQKYMEIDGRKYCYLYFGENKHRVEVHPDFKSIVILSAEKELEGLDVELEQPAPFLNRFEKFFLRVSNIMSIKKIKELIFLRNQMKQLAKGYTSRIIGLSIDMITSICVKKSDIATGAIDIDKPTITMEENPDNTFVIDPIENAKQQQLMIRMTTLNYLLNKLSEAELDQFLKEHPYESLRGVFTDLTNKAAIKLCLFTFSNPMEIEPLREDLESTYKVKIYSSEDIFNQGLEKRSMWIKNYKENTIIIQFVYTEHLSLIAQLKSNIEYNSKITKMLFIVHLERDPKKREKLKTNIGINYWNGWNNAVLDSIHDCPYTEFVQIRNLTFEQLLLSDIYTTGVSLLKEACIVCIMKIIHEQQDSSLRANMFNIRNMIEKDQQNTFINEFREKLKKVNIFKKDTRTWIEIVNERTCGKDNYVDFDIELLNFFKETYSDPMKRYLIKLNFDLMNIASYSLGYLCDEPAVREVFQKNLCANIQACNMNDQTVRTAMSQVTLFYKIPFLSSIYKKIDEQVRNTVVTENKVEFLRLGNDFYKLKVLKSFENEQNHDDIEKLKNKILDAETYLNKMMEKIIVPFIEEINVKLGDIKDCAYIKECLIYDIIMITSKRLKIITSEDIYEIYKAICVMIKKEAGSDLKTMFCTSCTMTIGFEKSVTFLMELISISNYSYEDIVRFNDTLTKNTTNFCYNYDDLDHIINFCQEKLIPEFDDPKLDLKVFRDKYESMIDRLFHDNQGLQENDPNIFNFKSLIICFSLLEIMPYQKKVNYLSALKSKKNQKQRFGSKSDLDFIREEILKMFFDSADFEKLDTENYCLVLSEYIVVNATMLKFDLFSNKDYDKLFSRFNKSQLEKIACAMSFSISKRIPPFYSLKQAQSLNIQTDPVLKEYDKFLRNIDISKPRNAYFIVGLIDNLFIKGMNDPDRRYEVEFMDMLKLVIKNADFTKNFTSLKNIIFYSLLRVLFNSKLINQTLVENAEIRNQLEQIFIENSRSKEYFLESPNSFIFTYFIQSVIREHGDLGIYQPIMSSVNNICTLILEEDVQGTITFFSEEMNKHFVDLKDKMDDYSYKREYTKMNGLFSGDYNGNKKMQQYMIGVALINKFVNSIKTTDEAVVQNLRKSYIASFENTNFNPHYIQLLKIIVDDTTLDFSNFIGGDVDKKYEVRLRKTFLQFMLVSIIFDEFGYDFNAWKNWTKEIVYPNFKCKVVSNNNISNSTSIAENIIVERLSDGSYQDYGGNYGKNLGIYRCECGFLYSIGQCGYAMAKSRCPRCNNEIGGENHQMIERKGHMHIKGLEELFKIITDEYYTHSHRYNMHTVINHSALEIIPLNIIKLGGKTFVEKRKAKNVNEFWRAHYVNMFLKHLYDHMYLTIIPEIQNENNKLEFKNIINKLFNFENAGIKELYGTMSSQKINNAFEYLLAHVKNDIDTISKELHFENPVDIFDWLRANLTIIVMRLFENESLVDGEKITLVDEPEALQPQEVLIKQERFIQAMTTTDTSTKHVVKSLFFRKVDGDLLKNNCPAFKTESHYIYQFCRHNKYDRNKVISSFNKQLETSEFTLLKQIIKYNHVLAEFPRMVKANLDISYYLMNNYSRIFNFAEACEMELSGLKDPKLDDLFEEYRHVWTKIIPKHEDTNPEVFSFAFMCQQNLNVSKFIERLLSPGGAKFIDLIFVDPSDYASQELLYSKSILRTFIEYFHNMFVKLINHVLLIKEGDIERTLVEFIDDSSIITSFDFIPVVENNFWYNTETSKENEINFDLKRIEYTLAKAMKKKWIQFEEKDLKYYDFKDTNVLESEQTIEGMISKIDPAIELDENMKRSLDDMPEEFINKSYDFILEIGEYIYQNFLFADSNKVLKTVLESISSGILKKRFNSYDEKYHSKLKVGHIGEYYNKLKEKRFDFSFTVNRGLYNKRLSDEQRRELIELVKDPNVDGKLLEDIKVEIKDTIRKHYHRGDTLLRLKFSDLALDFGDVHPGAEFLNDFRFEQYVEVAEILTDAEKVKKGTTAINRTSSNLYGHGSGNLEKKDSRIQQIAQYLERTMSGAKTLEKRQSRIMEEK
jgi:hypothetical protein